MKRLTLAATAALLSTTAFAQEASATVFDDISANFTTGIAGVSAFVVAAGAVLITIKFGGKGIQLVQRMIGKASA